MTTADKTPMSRTDLLLKRGVPVGVTWFEHMTKHARQLDSELAAAEVRSKELEADYDNISGQLAAANETIDILRRENGMQHTMLVAARDELEKP